MLHCWWWFLCIGSLGGGAGMGIGQGAPFSSLGFGQPASTFAHKA
jgi:hypothetical protein